MRMIHRILLVIVLFAILGALVVDYAAFHGAYILGQVGDGVIVNTIDGFWGLFQGKDAFTNFMFIAALSVGLMVGALTLIYKFIKG